MLCLMNPALIGWTQWIILVQQNVTALIIWPISLNAHAEHKMFGMVTPADRVRHVFYTNKSFVSFSYKARSKTLVVIFF